MINSISPFILSGMFISLNQNIWKEYQQAKENKTIQEAPEEPVGREEQGRVGELREPEEFRKCSKCKG
jgi:hypothetical protein